MPFTKLPALLFALTVLGLTACGSGDEGNPADPVAAMERRLDCRPSDANFAPLRTDLGPLGQCLLRAQREDRLPEEAEQNGLSAICAGGLGTIPPEQLTDEGVAACLIENGVDPNKDGGP